MVTKTTLEFSFTFPNREIIASARHFTRWRLLLALQSQRMHNAKALNYNTLHSCCSQHKCTLANRSKDYHIPFFSFGGIWMTWNNLDVLLYVYDLFALLFRLFGSCMYIGFKPSNRLSKSTTKSARNSSALDPTLLEVPCSSGFWLCCQIIDHWVKLSDVRIHQIVQWHTRPCHNNATLANHWSAPPDRWV